MAGLHSYAVHLPRLTLAAQELQQHLGRAPARLQQKRVPDHDEDETTLAIAAARRLRALGGPEPAFLVTASGTAGPFAALVAEALGLEGARASEHRGPLAGVAALLEACDAADRANARVEVVLTSEVVASEVPTQYAR